MPKRKTLSDDAVDFLADPNMRAWLENNRLKLKMSYLRRGRSLGALSDDALIEAWIANMKKHCSNPDNRSVFDNQNDLDAELELRELQMPLEQVKDDLELLRQYFVRLHKDMTQKPEAWAESRDAMKEDIVDFLIELEEAKEKSN